MAHNIPEKKMDMKITDTAKAEHKKKVFHVFWFIHMRTPYTHIHKLDLLINTKIIVQNETTLLFDFEPSKDIY